LAKAASKWMRIHAPAVKRPGTQALKYQYAFLSAYFFIGGAALVS
jgi:hypothetical protein